MNKEKNIIENPLIIECRKITSKFENDLSAIAIQSRNLTFEDREKIILDLQGTLQNINYPQ